MAQWPGRLAPASTTKETLCMSVWFLAFFLSLFGCHPADSGGQVPSTHVVMQPTDSGGQAPSGAVPLDSGGQAPSAKK